VYAAHLDDLPWDICTPSQGRVCASALVARKGSSLRLSSVYEPNDGELAENKIESRGSSGGSGERGGGIGLGCGSITAMELLAYREGVLRLGSPLTMRKFKPNLTYRDAARAFKMVPL
jgi:hypothetical protein